MIRSSRIAALLLFALVVLSPVILLLVAPSRHNLAEIDIVTLVLYWTIGSTLLIAPLLALTTLPGDWFERWWKSATSYVMSFSNRAFGIGLVAVTLALTAALSWYCFANRPTTADEIAQLFHARVLLSGHLSLPPDPNPEFFAIDNVIDRPRWMSQFPIGGPAILAIGVALGAPWLLNSVLTALLALNVYRFAQVAYDEAQARTAGALVAASPMVLIMGGSQMNHTPTAFLVTLALASLARWLQNAGTHRMRHAVIVGVALGAAITIRPLDGALATAMMGSVMLWRARRNPARWWSLAAATVGVAVPVALLLVANWRMTGSPFLFGYQVLWGPNHSWGLHVDPLGTMHDATRAMLLGLKYVVQLDWALTAWPIPSLLLIAFALSASRETTRWDLGLLAGFLVQLVGYAMYWHDGQFVGPRFLFTAAPAVLILAARAPFMLMGVTTGRNWRLAAAVVPACVFMSWVRPMPPYGVRGITKDYRDTRTLLKREAPSASITAALPRSLIFVQEGASARMVRRLWGLGISRQDAARLLRGSDACSLFDAMRREEGRSPADTLGRLGRIESSTVLLGAPDDVVLPSKDPFFLVNRNSKVSAACVNEINLDMRVGNSVVYGPLLLENRFDALGRLSGHIIYAMNLGERNDILRARFGDRQWFRYEIPMDQIDGVPVLVPYEAPAAIGTPTKKAP